MKPTVDRAAAPLTLLVLVSGLVTAAGCGLFADELPALEHSDGFFSDFDQATRSALAEPTDEARARRLRFVFAEALQAGPDDSELVCTGPTWAKVSTFLEIGLRTADVMSEVAEGAPNRVEMYRAAADVVLRSDLAAVEQFNARVEELGRREARLEPTGDQLWASLDLTLTLSEQAVVQRWVEDQQWVEGHWARTEGYYEDVWVPGYTDTMWQPGSCWEEWAGRDCEIYWVDDYCWDEYIVAGYWDSYCAEYDAWGNCVYWEEYWVDLGYYQTYCEYGYYEEVCWDFFETFCEEGMWVEVWIEGYWTQGPWIPGETYWVEGYWADTSGYQPIVLLEEEAEILREGINVVLRHGEEMMDAPCFEALRRALDLSDEAAEEEAGPLLRGAIMACLSGDSPAPR